MSIPIDGPGLDSESLWSMDTSYLRFIALYHRHLKRAPTVEQLQRRFGVSRPSRVVDRLVSGGYVRRVEQAAGFGGLDLLELTPDFLAAIARQDESCRRDCMSTPTTRLRQLRRVILIAQTLRELPVCTMDELHEAVIDEHNVSFCQRTLRRDVEALEMLGFVERRMGLRLDHETDCDQRRVFLEFVGSHGLNVWPFEQTA